MIRNIFRIGTLLMLIITLASCEKVIKLDLQASNRQVVIEGTIANTQNPVVRISMSKTFEESNDFVGLTGATVAIKVNNGNTYTLTSTAPGVYETNAFTGMPDSSYSLTLTVNGQTFTSTSIMPKPVTLDTITINEIGFGSNKNKTVYPSYNDPIGKGNSYRLINYINGKQEKFIYVQNDELTDGRTVTRPLINRDSNIKSGDLVTTQLLCIDQPVYTYWFSLSESSTGENQSATPANPVSNIEGGALGYFSAYTVSQKTIVVP